MTTMREQDIETLLIWAYSDQQVDQVTRAIGGPKLAAVSFEAVADLGVRIDGGQHRDRFREVDPDAIALHEAVMALPDAVADMPADIRRMAVHARGMVIACAKAGVPPGIAEYESWEEPRRDLRGRIVKRDGGIVMRIRSNIDLVLHDIARFNAWLWAINHVAETAVLLRHTALPSRRVAEGFEIAA